MGDIDETEDFRRARFAELNEATAKAQLRDEAEARYGRVWTTDELQGEFDVLGFMAPYVVVRRRSDGKQGSLEFQHNPRFYFNWQED